MWSYSSKITFSINLKPAVIGETHFHVQEANLIRRSPHEEHEVRMLVVWQQRSLAKGTGSLAPNSRS